MVHCFSFFEITSYLLISIAVDQTHHFVFDSSRNVTYHSLCDLLRVCVNAAHNSFGATGEAKAEDNANAKLESNPSMLNSACVVRYAKDISLKNLLFVRYASIEQFCSQSIITMIWKYCSVCVGKRTKRQQQKQYGNDVQSNTRTTAITIIKAAKFERNAHVCVCPSEF